MFLLLRLAIITFFFSFIAPVFGAKRTAPPKGALVVRPSTPPALGEFATISSAVAALPNDNTSQTIFIFPGTYSEQVNVTRSGPLTIFGFTNDTTSYTSNTVTIQSGIPATAVGGSNDLSGTLRIHKDDFRMYNVDVKNTFGIGSQAIAISQYGSRVGLYACGFFGYQDTLLANQGTQVYLGGYIEGATDFIFGRVGLAYFGGNTIAIKAAGWVTANGRESNDSGSYVFNQNTIVLTPDAAANATGRSFLGRPWGDFAKVIFKNTLINAPLSSAIWSIWNPGDERTDNVFFVDYNSTGPGAQGAVRPSFATVLTDSQAALFNISSAVGSDFASWVDLDYLV